MKAKISPQTIFQHALRSITIWTQRLAIYFFKIMLHSRQQAPHAIIQLKHMELTPEILTVTADTVITLKVCTNNSASLSNFSEGLSRKFIFLLQETDQQTAPLSEGEQYQFTIPLTEVGTYHLQCLNYPRIKSKIELAAVISESSSQKSEEQQSKIFGSPSAMQNIAQVQQQKQQETKEEALESRLESSPSRSDYADYEKMLSDEQIHYDYMPNKYLKYFKEEFKLWRDFFQHKSEKPQKEKYGSQGPEKLSTSSLSFSEKNTEKEESVVSRLRSHQEISDIHEEELTHPKTMKKTNSEYCFNVDREVEKTYVSSNSKRRPFNTNTSSPHQRTEQSQADNFLDWACNWAYEGGFQQIVIKNKGDRHLTDQWFTYLHNSTHVDSQNLGSHSLCLDDQRHRDRFDKCGYCLSLIRFIMINNKICYRQFSKQVNAKLDVQHCNEQQSQDERNQVLTLGFQQSRIHDQHDLEQNHQMFD